MGRYPWAERASGGFRQRSDMATFVFQNSYSGCWTAGGQKRRGWQWVAS